MSAWSARVCVCCNLQSTHPTRRCLYSNLNNFSIFVMHFMLFLIFMEKRRRVNGSCGERGERWWYFRCFSIIICARLQSTGSNSNGASHPSLFNSSIHSFSGSSPQLDCRTIKQSSIHHTTHTAYVYNKMCSIDFHSLAPTAMGSMFVNIAYEWTENINLN